MTRIKRATAVWLTAILAATLLTVAPAGASNSDAGIDSAEDVEVAIEQVLEEVPLIEELLEESIADVADLDISEGADVVVQLETEDGAIVEIPNETDEPVVLENSEGETLEIELPGNGEDAEVLDDGSVVFENAVTDTDIVVQAQKDGGARIITVIDGADAPTAFDFDLDQITGISSMQVLEDGSVVIYDGDQQLADIVPAPWAFDAIGNEVPAWYTISGPTLVLNVDHSAVLAYPVIADPCWRCLLGAAGTALLSVAVAGAVCAGSGGLACASALYAAGNITLATYQTIKSGSAKPLLCKTVYLPLSAYPSGYKTVKFIKRFVLSGNQVKRWTVCK